MGLDWMLDNKIKEGFEEEVKQLGGELQLLDKSLQVMFGAYCRKQGVEIPCVYQDPIVQEFHQTQACRDIRAKMATLRARIESMVITPMQTVEAPRIGFDDAATAWAVEHWEKNQNGETLEDFLKRNNGLYVAELAKHQDGFGAVTGCFAEADSYRGKMLGFCKDVLSDSMISEAWGDHTPEQLVDYAKRLKAAADLFEQSRTTTTDEENKQLKTVRDAARWAHFWGSNGHGMWAWY